LLTQSNLLPSELRAQVVKPQRIASGNTDFSTLQIVKEQQPILSNH
jgi:hypothetical protein